ncbi:MAG: CCA tRNA nucleotidyltransferase, partial [Armatimonadetes bacterium]|nr:CCA tRNA nucleotidyltransferase [Anaerolineae bacterium]
MPKLRAVLGDTPADLVARIAQNADAPLYLVGGVVRDVLVNRRTLDLDFVLEGDAIGFARQLQRLYGGDLTTHPPFGTAKWQLAGATLADALQTTPDLLPAHLDFAMARRETYAHPGALPTVTPDSIQTDLQRRDFSINALAVALDADQLLDPFGGLDDLRSGIVRVLHDASFEDDPTRILRAVKYAARLGFTIEPHTAALLTGALPGLGIITGERIRHELTLLLVEPEPERGYADLAARGALAASHPALNFDESDSIVFQGARHLYTPELAWYAWLARLTPADVGSVCRRLLIGRKESDV